MEDLIELLDSSNPDESDISTNLRNRTSQILTSNHPPPSPTQLLTEIIKPLFSKSQHQSITSTGRKNLISPPSLPTRITEDPIFSPPPPWKNAWTIPLLLQILDSYVTDQWRSTVEGDFHLLVPPLLILLDDAEISFKISGCTCLTRLCSALVMAKSDVLKRSGLAEVFLDALRGVFHYLPGLTPEQDSLGLLQAVYPAWMGVVKARFGVVENLVDVSGGSDATTTERDEVPTIVPLQKQKKGEGVTATKQQLTPAQISSEIEARTNHLSTLLRHSLLYTISHLRTGPDAGTTTSIPITTFLLTQIPLLLRELHIYAAVHLKSLVPMLMSTLRDPFVLSAVEMMRAAVDAVQAVVVCCWVRVREKWWMEVLRGLVEAWLNCRDELGGRGNKELEDVMGKIERVVKILRDVVGVEFDDMIEKLVEEEPDLRGLFGEKER